MFGRYSYVGNDPVNNTDPTGMVACQDANCDTAKIDHEVTKGAPPIDSSLGGNPDAETVLITFENDDPNGADTDQAITTETAMMVEEAARNSDAFHVNINSTNGGQHSPRSRHSTGQAVDINRVDGGRVDDATNSGAVDNLQSAFAQTSNVRENFGPNSQTATRTDGTIRNVPAVAAGHQNHIHASGQD
jgi:hypothetical protein